MIEGRGVWDPFRIEHDPAGKQAVRSMHAAPVNTRVGEVAALTLAVALPSV